jgi:hypothetical protein
MVQSPSTSLGLSGLTTVSAGNVTALGVIPLPVPGLVTALNGVLNPLLASLDDLIVNQLNDLLGLNIGGADIGAENMTCSGIKLVG